MDVEADTEMDVSEVPAIINSNDIPGSVKMTASFYTLLL
jgi:hypothetical protein